MRTVVLFIIIAAVIILGGYLGAQYVIGTPDTTCIFGLGPDANPQLCYAWMTKV